MNCTYKVSSRMEGTLPLTHHTSSTSISVSRASRSPSSPAHTSASTIASTLRDTGWLQRLKHCRAPCMHAQSPASESASHVSNATLHCLKKLGAAMGQRE